MRVRQRGQYADHGHMTVREFMGWARLGRTKTYAEINAGRLVAIKVGRKTLIPYHEALQWSWRQPRFVNWLPPHDVYGYPPDYDEEPDCFVPYAEPADYGA